MASMKTDSGPTREKIKSIEKGKGKDFRRQSGGKDREGKKREESPKKKSHPGNKRCKFCSKQQRHILLTPKEMIVQRTIKNAISVKDGIILPLSVRRKRKVKSIFWQKTVKVPRNRFCKLNKSRPLNPVVNDGLRRSALTVLEDVSNTRSVVSFFIHSFATQVTMPGTSSHLPRKVWVTVYKGDAYLAVNL